MGGQTMIIRDHLYKIADQLALNATIEDVIDRLLLFKFETGRQQADAGKIIPHQEVEQICMSSVHETEERRRQPTEKGWNVFRTLGNDAATGCLKNASEHHDRYLYGKEK